VETERARRIGENEALFRRVNNAVEEINDARGAEIDELRLVCECGQQSCIEQIQMSRGEYEALRHDPTQFAVKPGHEIPSVEQVIAMNERYWTVEKHEGTPAQVARELDESDS
jgi:hypothetical protein